MTIESGEMDIINALGQEQFQQRDGDSVLKGEWEVGDSALDLFKKFCYRGEQRTGTVVEDANKGDI